MNKLPDGWKNGKEHAGHDTLFKVYKTGTLQSSFDNVDRIKTEILTGPFSSCTFFTLSNDYLTITLNDLDTNKSLDELIAYANLIDSLIKA